MSINSIFAVKNWNNIQSERIDTLNKTVINDTRKTKQLIDIVDLCSQQKSCNLHSVVLYLVEMKCILGGSNGMNIWKGLSRDEWSRGEPHTSLNNDQWSWIMFIVSIWHFRQNAESNHSVKWQTAQRTSVYTMFMVLFWIYTKSVKIFIVWHCFDWFHNKTSS